MEATTSVLAQVPVAASQVDDRERNLLVPPTVRGDRQLPVFCPQCGTRIEIRKGLCGNRLIDAIMLQAERIGTELECQRCETRFVFQKLEETPSSERGRKSGRSSLVR